MYKRLHMSYDIIVVASYGHNIEHNELLFEYSSLAQLIGKKLGIISQGLYLSPNLSSCDLTALNNCCNSGIRFLAIN